MLLLCQIGHRFPDKRAKVEMAAMREDIHFSPEDSQFIDRPERVYFEETVRRPAP